MITITKAAARSFSLDYMDLWWEIASLPSASSDAAQHEIYDYDFYVQRSESPVGDFETVGGPFRDTYHFRDGSAHLRHKWRQLFYKIRVVHRATNEAAEFGPIASGEAPPDLIAAEVVRQEDVLFREFVGRRCWFFKARTFGPACSCYDVTTGRRTRSGHLPCFGTGFLGGFHAPVEVWVKFDPNPLETNVAGLKEKTENLSRVTMISFPPASPRDILVESENRRWRVVSLNGTERLRSTLHQELTVKEIEKGEVEYSIPLNVDLSKLEPIAPRNYSNPHHIEDDGDFSDIRSFFGDPRRSR